MPVDYAKRSMILPILGRMVVVDHLTAGVGASPVELRSTIIPGTSSTWGVRGVAAPGGCSTNESAWWAMPEILKSKLVNRFLKTKCKVLSKPISDLPVGRWSPLAFKYLNAADAVMSSAAIQAVID